MKYRYVFVAGTFDGIHKGHEALLRQAFKEGAKVTIGVTSDVFVKKFKSKQNIRSFDARYEDLKVWLNENNKRATIVPIDDPYEPAAAMMDVDALVVSRQTRRRGEEINKLRVNRGLPELTLLEVPIMPAQDGKPISSTRMRNGEIDGQGTLVMPESLRSELSQPLGNVLMGEAIPCSIEELKRYTMVTVGDVATKTLLDAGITPELTVIDGKVGRKPYRELDSYLTSLKTERINVKSGPGFISQKAIAAIAEWAKRARPTTIIVDGEEDLLALPAIQYAPVGSIVYYGQPPIAAWACGPIQEGLVEVVVDKDSKKKIVAILRKFT